MGSLQVAVEIAGVRHAGGLDQHDVRLDRVGYLVQALDEVGLDAGAEDGALADLEHVEVLAFDEGAVETHVPELVHEDEEADDPRAPASPGG